MKISLHIEANTVEEYREALLALGVAVPASVEVKSPDLIATPEPVAEKPAPFPATQPKAEDTEVQEAQLPPPLTDIQKKAAELKEKRQRGRPRVKREAVSEPAESTREVEAAQVEPEAVAPEPGNGAALIDVESARVELLNAFAGYVQTYGTGSGYADVSKLLQQHFGKDVRKASHVTDANLDQATKLIRRATKDNPFSREVLNG